MLGPGAEQPGGESAAQPEEQRAQAWAADLTALHARIAPRFRRAEPRRRALVRRILLIVRSASRTQAAECA